MTGKSEGKKPNYRHHSESGAQLQELKGEKLKLLKSDLDILSVHSLLSENQTIWSIAIPKSGTNSVWLGIGGSPLENEEIPTKLEKELLIQVDNAGTVQKKIDINFWPYNILLTKNNKILVSSAWKSFEIMKVKKSGKFSTFCDMQTYYVYGMTENDQGEIFACVQSRGYYAGKIVRFSAHGECLQDIERDENKRRIFSFPFDITLSQNGNICVKDENNLLVLTMTGKVITKVKALDGHWSVHKIISDRYDHIIGGGKQCTHIIDMKGKWINSYKKGGTRTVTIWGLALDHQGNIWMGTDNGQLIVARYLQ